MSNRLRNAMAAAGSSGEKVYIEDVFSTYLYTGTGAAQTINNGIALAEGFTITPGTALAGGYFGGFISTTGNGVATHALIVAPKATGETVQNWKSTLDTTAGTTSVIDGPTNSSNMNNASHPAAGFCEGLTIGGYSDWYMPAKNELEVLYYFLKPTTGVNSIDYGSNANAVSPEPISTNYSSGSPAQTSAAAFQSGGAEAFAANGYWSSTQSPFPFYAAQAIVLSFLNGAVANYDKTTSFYARAVRRVAVADALLDPYRVTGKGGMVWLKGRSGATDHALYDTARGATKDLVSNSTAAETTQSTGLTAFGATGFSIGALTKLNASAATYASWTFRKQAKFFDVVTYTGNGVAGRTVAHNLGSVPGMIIVKCTSAGSTNWAVYHRSQTSASYYTKLNLTDVEALDTTVWNGTAPTSSVFSVGTSALTNTNGATYVAYLFAHNAGGFGASGTDSVISCGSFTTDVSGNVGTVNLGWEPQWLLVKATTAAQSWFIFDVMRGWTVSGIGNAVTANSAGAELNYFGGTDYFHPTATGFAGSGNFFGANTPVIYIAIRRPMKTPTSGTSVFAPIARTGDGSIGANITGVGFPPDFSHTFQRSGGNYHAIYDRLRGASIGMLDTASTSAEGDLAATVTAFLQDGITVSRPMAGAGVGATNTSGQTYINHLFRRAPGFFDVVCYTGTGAVRTVNHNLGVAPEMMIVKSRSNGVNPWWVYVSYMSSPSTSYLNLNGNFAQSTGTTVLWNSTNPTSTVFSLGTYVGINGSGETYVAYLFASCPGVSKVGSYTGTGAAQTIDCGFTAGARFVLIKRTDSTGDWYTWDSARGIVSGNDPYLLMNSSATEVTSTDYIDPVASGFEISSTAPAAINASGGSFIYLAIA